MLACLFVFLTDLKKTNKLIDNTQEENISIHTGEEGYIGLPPDGMLALTALQKEICTQVRTQENIYLKIDTFTREPVVPYSDGCLKNFIMLAKLLGGV